MNGQRTHCIRCEVSLSNDPDGLGFCLDCLPQAEQEMLADIRRQQAIAGVLAYPACDAIRRIAAERDPAKRRTMLAGIVAMQYPNLEEMKITLNHLTMGAPVVVFAACGPEVRMSERLTPADILPVSDTCVTWVTRKRFPFRIRARWAWRLFRGKA